MNKIRIKSGRLPEAVLWCDNNIGPLDEHYSVSIYLLAAGDGWRMTAEWQSSLNITKAGGSFGNEYCMFAEIEDDDLALMFKLAI
jgi:hypothetical protein